MNRLAISDRYEYINEESISERLKCIICCNPLIDPMKTKCKPREHIFCNNCIKQWILRDSSCPTCRQYIQIQDLTPITEGILVDMLNELLVQCSICEKTGLERANFDEHINKECSKQNIRCSSSDIQCPWNGTRGQLDNHLKICPYTQLRPIITQFIDNDKELKEQINRQKTLIDKLQEENRQLKQQNISISKPPIGNRSSQQQNKSTENPIKSSILRNSSSSSQKVSCDNCSDCWRGAVRGTYFKGQAGGGFQPGTTLLLCDCHCHK